jgi:hypothetical protein
LQLGSDLMERRRTAASTRAVVRGRT